jgi:hypothetical protein
MLSAEELKAVSDSELDLSPELQIILIWLSRATGKPIDVLLEGLRDTIFDWQKYKGDPE